jgi:hypothetical protein
VFIHTKIALSAFVLPFAASAAIANDLESMGREPPHNAFTCPWLEGYPDCHPGAVHQPDIEPARRHPVHARRTALAFPSRPGTQR